MEKLMLLGDEALAQGALDAGISGFYGYPGTPSTRSLSTFNDPNKQLQTRFTGPGHQTKKQPWNPLWA